MKKILFACIALASFGAFGCSSPCDDYADKIEECCADYPEATKAVCQAVADAARESGEDDACEAALDAYTCTPAM